MRAGDLRRREVTKFREGERQLRLLYIRRRELVGHPGKPEALFAAEHDLPLSLPGQAQRNRLAVVRQVLRRQRGSCREHRHRRRLQREAFDMGRRHHGGQARRRSKGGCLANDSVSLSHPFVVISGKVTLRKTTSR